MTREVTTQEPMTSLATTQTRTVENRLREMILDMEIGPGERLTERWAEAQTSASRTPVRAALLKLEAEGLVRREGRGWMVAPLDLEQVEQLFVYREVLEIGALRLAADKVTAEAARSMTDKFEACGPDMSREAAHRLGTAFHLWLAELSGNEFIIRGVADVMTRLARVRWLDTNPEHHGWDEHKAILASLCDGDIDRAAHLLAAHIGDTRVRLLATLKDARRSLRARGVITR